eukprot:Colp12_sorted_trinity150504_noHs@12212
MEDKRNIIAQRLDSRHEALQELAEKRKEVKDSVKAEAEDVNVFHDNFKKEQNELNAALDNTSLLPLEKCGEHLDSIEQRLIALQKYVADSAHFLPAYDLRSSQQKLNDLRSKSAEARTKFVPKKKFSFKSKKAASATQNATVSNTTATPVSDVVTPTPSTQSEPRITKDGLYNLSGQTLVRNSSDLVGTDFELQNLKNCLIVLKGTVTALHISKLENCVLVIGPVRGSILADGCVSCKLVISCHQLRLHNSWETDIYLQVGSKAIIEDCHHLRFGPYTLSYSGLETHKMETDRTVDNSNWRLVDDFKWLKSNQPSPNWTIVPEEAYELFNADDINSLEILCHRK